MSPTKDLSHEIDQLEADLDHSIHLRDRISAFLCELGREPSPSEQSLMDALEFEIDTNRRKVEYLKEALREIENYHNCRGTPFEY